MYKLAYFPFIFPNYQYEDESYWIRKYMEWSLKSKRDQESLVPFIKTVDEMYLIFKMEEAINCLSQNYILSILGNSKDKIFKSGIIILCL